ncbi:XRE family transcriptional regulator [Rhizobium oryzihabitans]|uniref:XRE family transcriptional regulator n=1 Tax=Rhizobium oryzihabitans TaxID=2267833 RepID=UPI0040371668
MPWHLAATTIVSRFTSFYVLNTLNDVYSAILMTYDAFVEELARAGLTIREFASLLGMRPNSITNNRKRGEVPDHLAVIAALLSELRHSGVPAAPVFARLGLTKKKPRGAASVGRFAGDKQGTLELRS